MPTDPNELNPQQDYNEYADHHSDSPATLSRRAFIQLGALAAGAALAGMSDAAPAQAASPAADPRLEEMTIAEMQALMTAGRLSSLELVNRYLARIQALDKQGPGVNAILELNPEARAIAMSLDQERRRSGPRGPLHGIPVLLKGNIDTADQMSTTAGSLALMGPAPSQDATVAARLRAAGAVILGKSNLSEWANFRSTHSSSGWSAQGGQTHNPYVIDRNPCGSSSGSGAGVSANFCAASLGTETDGSIVCPANANGVVGIKPTVGLTSRAGVVPISHNQDTVGPHGRTVADAAAVLGALVGVDPRDPATAASAGHSFTNYTQFLDPNGLKGARIGVVRKDFSGFSYAADAMLQASIEALQAAGATIVDPADIPTADQIAFGSDEFTVLLFDFKQDLNAYLATRSGLSVHTLADLIAFNNAHAAQEMPFFRQEIFELAQATDGFADRVYIQALANSHILSRQQGIDAVLQQHNLDALIAPTDSPAWTTDLVNGDLFLGASSSPAAMAGYPLVVVPAAFAFGLPLGLTFMGTAWSEPKLIKLAYAFEQATKVRRPPQFLATAPLDQGSQVMGPHGPVSLPASRASIDRSVDAARMRARLVRHL